MRLCLQQEIKLACQVTKLLPDLIAMSDGKCRTASHVVTFVAQSSQMHCYQELPMFSLLCQQHKKLNGTVMPRHACVDADCTAFVDS